MDGELTHDIIDNVLETIHKYCSGRYNCEGCRYAYKAAWTNFFLSCALTGSPCNWPLHKVGGDNND